MKFLNKISNDKRVGLLAEKLKEKRLLRFLEAHNGISALIAEEAKIEVEEQGNKKTLEFDGFWESSFTDSASKGLPDIEIVSIDSRLATINQIAAVTKKPIIVDADTGGEISQFEYTVKKLEGAGASMVVIEDKVFPKRNSLEGGTRQELEKPELFAEKIRRGQTAKNNPQFLIIARIESLIAGLGLADALARARIYLAAGADGIIIHSKKEKPDEILEFAQRFKELPEEFIGNKILGCIPTTYNSITEEELAQAGFNIVIYANHLLRAGSLAMEKTAKEILKQGRSLEASAYCLPVKEIFQKVGFLEVKERDKELAELLGSKVKVIIPAAGQDELAQQHQRPRALIEIQGKTILERQIETLKRTGLDKFVVIRGFQGELFQMENITYCDNPAYQERHILHSLFCAQDEMNSPFIFLLGDILFNENIIRDLLKVSQREHNDDMVLVVDNSFQHLKERIERPLDLVVTKNKTEDVVRKVVGTTEEEVSFIGRNLDKQTADYEFIGIAYFSQRGAEILKQVYEDCLLKYQNSRFHQAANIFQADITDFLQEVIDRGYKVKVLKTYQGWMEIENEDDLKTAQAIF